MKSFHCFVHLMTQSNDDDEGSNATLNLNKCKVIIEVATFYSEDIFGIDTAKYKSFFVFTLKNKFGLRCRYNVGWSKYSQIRNEKG